MLDDETAANILASIGNSAELEALGPSGLIDLFRHLELHGYVTSTESGFAGYTDGRAIWWSLTPTGRRTALRASGE